MLKLLLDNCILALLPSFSYNGMVMSIHHDSCTCMHDVIMISDWSEFVLLLYLASQQQSVVAIFQEKVQWQLCITQASCVRTCLCVVVVFSCAS
jgi:hypothetical protein